MGNKKGQVIAYVRVSTSHQDNARQINIIREALGEEPDKIFTETFSAKTKERPVFQEMLKYVREGDTIVITSIDRLARSLKNFLDISDSLSNQGITLRCIKENITLDKDSNDPMQRLMIHVIAAFAEFERSIMITRVEEARAARIAAGLPLGKPCKLNDKQVDEARRLFDEGVSISRIARELKASRKTIYRAIKPGYKVSEREISPESKLPLNLNQTEQ